MITFKTLVDIAKNGPVYEINTHFLTNDTSFLIGEICVYATNNDDVVTMIFANGAIAFMHHHQNCCESVFIEDINGDLRTLINTPLNVFDERQQDDPNADESATWTFYTLRTIKGSVDIRWYGSSNGYYSESATIDVFLPKFPLSAHQQTALLKEATQ